MTASSTTECAKDRPGLVQLSLFPDKICEAYLVADSPKKVLYRIWIESNAGIHSVLKESGIKDNVLDKWKWPFDSMDAAKALFDRRIKEKTSVKRKRIRKYTLVYRI